MFRAIVQYFINISQIFEGFAYVPFLHSSKGYHPTTPLSQPLKQYAPLHPLPPATQTNPTTRAQNAKNGRRNSSPEHNLPAR